MGLTPDGAKAKAKTEAFIKKYGIAWPNGYGARATIKALGVRGYPTVLVIGTDGKVTWNNEMGGELRDAIDQALAVKSTR